MLKSINNLDITQNYKKTIKQPQSINFRAKELPIKQITDKGLKAASSAIASLGIASIALNSKLLPQDDGLVTFNVSDEQWKELIPTLAENITQKKFLGEGVEAKVYAINDKYVLRLLHDANSDLEFLSIEDIFEGRNFGQAIAKDQNGNTINKRVFGSSLYDRYSTDPKIYLQNLREYVNLSDEALEAFVSDIAFINSKGYCIDHRNPENFLYDKKTGKIGIVDISEKTFVNSIFPEAFEPYSHIWVLSPLLNGNSVIDIYKEFSISERQEFFELVEKLESRILPLCEKYGIPLAKWEKDRYLVTNLINLLDLRKKIDPIKCDNLQVPIFYERYPELIKFLNDV